ncbi:MAG: hypothetical protein ACREOS_06490 [Candidatus Dormibacteraceae bacterium]
MKNLSLTLLLAIGVMAGFWGGWQYSRSLSPAAPTAAVGRPAASPAAGQFARRGQGAAGLGGVVGQITAVNGNTLTIHDRATNADVKVQLGAATTITKQSAAGVSDLTPSENVTVIGSAGADGVVNARSVAVGGAGFGGGGAGSGGAHRPGAPTPSPSGTS